MLSLNPYQPPPAYTRPPTVSMSHCCWHPFSNETNGVLHHAALLNDVPTVKLLLRYKLWGMRKGKWLGTQSWNDCHRDTYSVWDILKDVTRRGIATSIPSLYRYLARISEQAHPGWRGTHEWLRGIWFAARFNQLGAAKVYIQLDQPGYFFSSRLLFDGTAKSEPFVPVVIAARHGYAEMVRLLLQSQSDVLLKLGSKQAEVSIDWALEEAMNARHFDVVCTMAIHGGVYCTPRKTLLKAEQAHDGDLINDLLSYCRFSQAMLNEN